MSLAVLVPQEWLAVSGTFEKRYSNASTNGMRVLERNGIETFLRFYEDPQQVAVYEFA